MTEPTDQELAVMYRWTLHTKWGFSGFMGTGGEEDFTQRCKIVFTWIASMYLYLQLMASHAVYLHNSHEQHVENGMKVQPIVRKLLIGVGSFAAFVSIVAAIIFQVTSGLTKVAASFFDALKKGDTNQALNYFSEQALNKSSRENLNDFRVDNSLADLKSLSWSNRSISNTDSGELIGTVNLKNGQNIPLTISFTKEGEDWKIYSIKKESTGIVDGVDGEELPSEKRLIRLSRKTTNRFMDVIRTNDFPSDYEGISHMWSMQTSPEELSTAFQTFRKVYENQPASHQYFKSLANMEPIFTEKPSINQNSVLVISGKYNIKPEYTFTYKYVFEGLSWKLIGVEANF